MALQTNGQLVVGGAFMNVNGIGRNGIARLNQDGTLDSTFLHGLSGLSGPLSSIAIQPDGKILIGGDFIRVNGVARRNLARLNTDGTLDPNFLKDLSGPDSWLYSIALQRDGKVVVAGSFSSVNGPPRYGLARLNGDGSLDYSFRSDGPGFGNPYAGKGIIASLALQSDGNLLVAGDFTRFNGVPRNCVARLYTSTSNASLSSIELSEGSLTPSFSPGDFSYLLQNVSQTLTLNLSTVDPTATTLIRVNGGIGRVVPWGANTGALSLNIGTNMIELSVTSQDGAVTNTYTLTAVLPVKVALLQFDATAVRFSTSGFHSRVIGASGLGNTVILSSTNLVDWALVLTNQPTPGAIEFLDPAATNEASQFYKVLEQ
jgi:uncharacterized delta-60 repeat protein